MQEWPLLLQQDFDTLSPELQELVYRSFYHLVYRDIFYLLGEHAMTEDMIHEAFFKIISIVGKHKVSNMTAWMKQVTRNLTLDFMKKINKERHIVDLETVISTMSDFGLGMHETSVANEVEDKIRDELLHQSIIELTPDYRVIITQFYIEGKSYKEIAVDLDLSEQAVSQKLMRARKKLLHQFQRKWADFHGR